MTLNRYKNVEILAKTFRRSSLNPSRENLKEWLREEDLAKGHILVFLHKIRAVHEFIPELVEFLDTEKIESLIHQVWSDADSDEELWTASLKAGIREIDSNTFEKACSFKCLELALVAASIRSQCIDLSSEKDLPCPGTLSEAALLSALCHRKVWADNKNEDDTFFQIIFDRLIGALKNGQYLFHHYDSLSTLLSHSSVTLLAEKTIEFIEDMNAFSNVRGVQEKTIKAYESAWCLLQQHSPHYSTQIQYSLNKITFEKSWKSKVKYGLLVVLHSKIHSIEKDCSFKSRQELCKGLIESLASNFLASIGSNLYLVLIKSMIKYTWINEFLPSLVNFLSDTPDSVSIEYLKTLWIPLIVKNLPLECSNKLYSELSISEKNPEVLSIKLCILKTQRMAGLVSEIDDVTFEQLMAYKDHVEPNVRISCFAVICQNLKKGIPPSLREFELFDSFIRSNLNIDSSSFRQKLLSHFTTLLLRVREYCMSSFKKNECAESVQSYMEGISSLEKYLVSRIYPGGNYQLTITSLSLLDVLNQVFYKSDDIKFKTSGITSTEPLVRFLQEKYGYLQFFNEEKNRKVLLRAVLNYMEDVRKTGVKILLRFPTPSESVLHSLLQNAKRLSNSSKISEIESAASYYHILHVWNKSEKLNVFEDLLKRYNSLLEQFSVDKSSKILSTIKEESALHGLLHVIRMHCLLHDSANIKHGSLVSLVNTLEESVDTMLRVMNVDNEEENPSFAKMGISIQSHIEDEDIIPIEISGDHQLILSCAWLNIKECARIAGFVVKYGNLVIRPEESDSFALSLELVHRCCNLVMKILRCCRHKGIMEGTNLAVEDIAIRLLSEKSPWKEIPAQILDKVLKEIVFQSSSTTRRSAGIPMLLQGLVSSESRLRRDSKLLEVSIERLLELSSSPGTSHETMDSSTSHALHILKSLVYNSAIGVGISPFLERIFICCVNNFTSDSWAIRNASLQLFGALQPRLIGQKRLRDDDSEYNMIFAKDFFEQNSNLSDYILTHLRSSAPNSKDRLASPNRVLMPLLALLSKLSNEENNPYIKTFSFQRAFLPHFYSPVINVRRLATRCFRQFSFNLESDFLELFLYALQSHSANFLHSMSYLLEALIKANPDSLVGQAFIQAFYLYPCFEIRSILGKYHKAHVPFGQISNLFSTFQRISPRLIDFKWIEQIKKYEFSELEKFSENDYERSLLGFVQKMEGSECSWDTICKGFFQSDVKDIRRMSSRLFAFFLPQSEVLRTIRELLDLVHNVANDKLRKVQYWTVVSLVLRLKGSNTEGIIDKVVKAFPGLSNKLFMQSDQRQILRYHPGYFSYIGNEDGKEELLLSHESHGEFDLLIGDSYKEKKDLLHQIINKSTEYIELDCDNLYSLEEIGKSLDELSLFKMNVIHDVQKDLNSVIQSSQSEKVKNIGFIALSFLSAHLLRLNESNSEINSFICTAIRNYSRGRVSESYRLNSSKASHLLAPYILKLQPSLQSLIFDSIWDLLSDENEGIRYQSIHFVSVLSHRLPSLTKAKRLLLQFIIHHHSSDLTIISPFKDFYTLKSHEIRDLQEPSNACSSYLFESEDGLNVYLDKVDNYIVIRDEVLLAKKKQQHTIQVGNVLKEHSNLLSDAIKSIKSNPNYSFMPFSPLWSNKLYPILVKVSCILSTINDFLPVDLKDLETTLSDFMIQN